MLDILGRNNYKSKFELKLNSSIIFPVITCLSAVLFQLKVTKLKLVSFKSGFQRKKRYERR